MGNLYELVSICQAFFYHNAIAWSHQDRIAGSTRITILPNHEASFGPGVSRGLEVHMHADGAISGQGLPDIMKLIPGAPNVLSGPLHSQGLLLQRLAACQLWVPNVGAVPASGAGCSRRSRHKCRLWWPDGDMAKGGAAQACSGMLADGQPLQDGGRHNHLEGAAWDEGIVSAIRRASDLIDISHALDHQIQRQGMESSCADDGTRAIEGEAILHHECMLRGGQDGDVGRPWIIRLAQHQPCLGSGVVR